MSAPGCTCGHGVGAAGPPVCCCKGIEVMTPGTVANPPGQPSLSYRAGTHRTFLSTMLARLSSNDFCGLTGLTTRETDDPAIALLDCWATVADVLTFYQERIANEGYLRTATEQRSVLELARLVGYVPRPGVAASTYLAFDLEQGHDEMIPPGTRAQSVPGPGELPQSYETSEPFVARDVFNELKIRMARPQAITQSTRSDLRELWLAGTATRLRPNDALLIQLDPTDASPDLRFVESIEEDVDAKRTRVVLQGGRRPRPAQPHVWTRLSQLVAQFGAAKMSSQDHQPKLPKKAESADTALRLAQLRHPELAGILYGAWAGAQMTFPADARVYALRVKAATFGSNAVKQPQFDDGKFSPVPWQLAETANVIDLDNAYPDVKDGTLVALVEAPALAELGGQAARKTQIFGVRAPIRIEQASREDYGIATKVTRIELSGRDAFSYPEGHNDKTIDVLRRFTVYTQSEQLELAEAPITDDVCGSILELDGLYEGLKAGRLLVVSGERADLPGINGVTSAELVTIADVRQGATGADGRLRPGEKNHTFVELADGGLARCYRRGTVKVHGNVVHATHGESRAEVLGSGDATVAHQRFTLRSSPLTYVSAPTPDGIASSLELRVDGVRWPERKWFLGLQATDRAYVTIADAKPVTTAVFPDGREGRRLPTGSENVRAAYRSGIGRPGNTEAGRITLLATKPLGVRSVKNPLPATGGADPESRDSARAHVPLPLKSLDRLVSLDDYRDFARVFAGVGKAAADRLSDGTRGVVVVTIAGDGGVPLALESDVVVNLRRSLRLYGDPSVRILVRPAERLVLQLSATIRLLPDYAWAVVEPVVRSALLTAFGFERRELGEDVALSQVLATVQVVPGVHSTVVDPARFTSDPVPTPLPAGFHPAPRVRARGARRDGGAILPSQHLYLAPELPELLELAEAKP